VYSRHLPPTKVINFLAGGLLILQSFADFLGFLLRPAALSPTLRPPTPSNSFDELKRGRGVHTFPFIPPPFPERTN